MFMYSYCMFIHRASWHPSANLTEVFPCFFLSCKANARVKTAKMGHGPHSPKFFFVLFYVLLFLCSVYFFIFVFYVLFVLCRSVCCLCVNVYCTTATGWLSNCS